MIEDINKSIKLLTEEINKQNNQFYIIRSAISKILKCSECRSHFHDEETFIEKINEKLKQ